ncbi:MAG: tRNA(Met) cytidine acetyltransferase TmcA [Halobacteriales archaeon]
MDLASLGRALRGEARRANERRLVVLSGDPEAGYDAAGTLLDAAEIPRGETTLVGPREALDCEHVPGTRADRLLGTTREAVVLDCHDACRPNALGRVAGAVDGGGLLVLLTPPLRHWPGRRDSFDETLAVPPFELDDVAGNFRRRLVETIQEHRGVAIVDVDAGTVESDGTTDPPPRLAPSAPAIPDDRAFTATVYEACLTADQVEAVRALEALREAGRAVVVEADRGRGKSAAAGLAAAGHALAGRDVLVTAPAYRSAGEVFRRARALVAEAGALRAVDGEPPRTVETDAGRVRFAPPVDARDLPGDPDVVIVDEAAALPVRLLEALLSAPAVAFVTTIHGYEGAGRGFSVRFRDRLDGDDHQVAAVEMVEPIRYAGGDPVEVWLFRALLLDAGPAPGLLVEDADPERVEYAAPRPERLLSDDHLLREAFGLLVLAHYRTEPNDLARLLDAPNVAVRALLYDGHVVSVALLAHEGGLDADTRASMYDGARVPGNMLPDVLTSQLRDEAAGEPVGRRVLRIATHPAVRSRGLGSHLLARVREEFDDVDWLGTGFGATPELLSFWTDNGFATVHLSTTRNDESGEYSALMLDPRTEAGRKLLDRHARWFLDRVADQLSDAIADADPDVVRAALAATDADPDVDLSPRAWRVVADTAYGPGMYATAPGAFRRLAVTALAGDKVSLAPRQQRLLVRKVLQGRDWETVKEELGYHSYGEAMRALGRAYRPLVDAYGDETARRQRDRYREE